MEDTPAQKSAKIVHILADERRTHCGINFRRQRYGESNTTNVAERSTCAKCTTLLGAILEETATKGKGKK